MNMVGVLGNLSFADHDPPPSSVGSKCLGTKS